MAIAKGSFAKATTTGQQTVSGVGFQAKALFLWTTRQTAAGLAETVHFACGFTDGTNQFGRSFVDTPDPGGIDPAQSQSNAKILRFLSAATTSATEAEASFVAFTADGFAINWTTDDGVASVIHYLAIGGDAVSAHAGNFSRPTTSETGNRSVTGVGFTPSLILFLPGADAETSQDVIRQDATNFSLSACNAAGEQWALSISEQFFLIAERRQHTDLSVGAVQDLCLLEDYAQFVSMDADGFTLNWLGAAAPAEPCFYLALSGVSSKVGSLTQPTSTGSQAVSGVGFAPDAVLFATYGDVAFVGGHGAAATNQMRFSLGAATGTAQGCTFVGATRTTSVQARSHSTSAVIQTITPDGTAANSTITSSAALTSLDSGGFTLNWTSADPTQRQILYLALASSTATPDTPDVNVTIDAVDITDDVLRWTFSIQATANGIDTATFDIDSSLLVSPIYRPTIHQEVAILENSVRIFAGYITSVTEQGFDAANGSVIVLRIAASDYSSLTARRYVTETLVGSLSASPGTTLAEFLQTLVDNYLDDYGVTLHDSQADGPALETLTFDNELLSSVLDRLAKATGWVWGIDYYQRLRMWAPGAIPAPFNLNQTDSPAQWTEDVKVEHTLNDRYANRIILVGDTITELGHVEVFTSTGVETFVEPAYTILGIPQGVIEVEGGSIPAGDRRWETVTIEGGDDAQWHYSLTTNRITRYDSSTGSTPTPLESGQTATVTFDGQFTPSATANDAGEQALYGVWEYVERVSGVADDATALAIANAILAERSSSSSAVVRYSTRSSGLAPGQTQTITAPLRNVSGEFLITDINTRVESGSYDHLTRDVTAVQNQYVEGNWRQLYKDWLGGTTSAAPATGGTIASGATVSLPGVFVILTADPESPVNDTGWFLREAGSPLTITLKARVAGTTETLESWMP